MVIFAVKKDGKCPKDHGGVRTSHMASHLKFCDNANYHNAAPL